MKLFELFQYNKVLNPKIWDENKKIFSEVRAALLRIADNFVEFIDLPNIKIEDIILTGSNANFNWTSQSDIDLHLVVDFKSIEKDCKFISDFFTDKKTLWNQNHDVKIREFNVEVYVQDASEPHVATGIYSVENNRWLKEPEYTKPETDDSAVKAKSDHIKAEIDKIIDSSGNEDAVRLIKEKIRTMRRSGLHKGGEFSTENLAFKELRKSGYLEKLNDYLRTIEDEDLSLE